MSSLWKKFGIGCLGLGMVLFSNPAQAIFRDENGIVDFQGSLRTLTAAAVNYKNKMLFNDHPADGFSQTQLRLTLSGHPFDWLSYEIHGVQSLSFSTTPNNVAPGVSLFGGGAAGEIAHYQALDARKNWIDSKTIQGSAFLWLDRFNIKFSLPRVDITIGRQAISLGTAYFWNPLDVFFAFDPKQFDRDYKTGVDAIKIDIALNDVTGISVIGALGRRVGITFDKFAEYLDHGDFAHSDYGSAFLQRIYTNLWGFDLNLQHGKVYGGIQLGGGFSGEIGPIEVRGEFAYFWAEKSEIVLRFEEVNYRPLGDRLEFVDHFSSVVGLGHRFENSLSIEAEYLYNGAGTDSTHSQDLFVETLKVGLGNGFHLGKHLTGVVVAYDLLPVLHSSLGWICSISDGSSLLMPTFTYSLADEVDFLLGALIGLGARPHEEEASFYNLGQYSEFGTYPNMYYMEFKFYF